MPGEWIGQGRITFSHSSGLVRFYTKWIIQPMKEEAVHAEQQIEQEGEPELLYNAYVFSLITDTSFNVALDNDLTGLVAGHGIIDDKKIAWEFHMPAESQQAEQLEGFEVYELQENGDYMLHAEYCSTVQYRTIIDGRIWKKK